jgi:subtilisin family serine protease
MRSISRVVAILAATALSAVAAGPADAGVLAGGGLPLRAGERTGSVITVQNGQTNPARTHKITLITGDVVQVAVYADGRQAASVAPSSEDPTGGGYQTFEQDKQVYVIPDAAAPYIAAGRLDRSLFNVTGLIEQGYDDARRATLPLIVSYQSRQAKARIAQPAPTGARKVRGLPSVGAVALAEDKKQARRFWEALDDDRTTGATPQLADGIAKIWLDSQVKASLDTSVPQIGAPSAWAAGYDGKGVKVAVLDTGIDVNHPDFAGQIAETKNFSDAPSVADKHGHGTHVASTVAGVGAASGGKRKGAAPGASLVIGKVLGDNGSGQASSIIAGMEWGAANARIVSMSLGGGASDGTDPLSQAVNNLTASTGALFVIAAGNAGPFWYSVATPGAADAALTVGAVDRADKIALFSSRGPRYGDHAVKPEITAPGVSIVAARAEGTLPQAAVDAHHARLSGTSMATPHVAGAAAILAQAHPNWTAAQLKSGLTTSAQPAAEQTVYLQGAGRLDVARAVRQRITASTGALSLGFFKGPYGDAKPVTKTVSYRNDTDHEVTLDLSVSATGDGSKPAAEGMLTVSPASLTVPAGGSADATVTLDLNKGDLRVYSGRLAATERGGEGQSVTTAVGFHKEFLHRVKITAIGTDGKPAGPGTWSNVSVWNNQAGSQEWGWLNADSTQTFDVRPGEYTVHGLLSTMDARRRVGVEGTAVVLPKVTVDRDVTVTLDARTAKEIVVRTPRPAEPTLRGITIHRAIGDRSTGFTRIYGYYTTRLSAVPTGAIAEGTFELLPRYVMEAPSLRMKAVNPEFALHPRYLGSWGPEGNLIDGRHRLPLVYVGAGRPENYEGRDVRGKIVLARETEGVTPADQVQHAAAAKAATVILVGKDDGWFGPLMPARPAVPTITIPLAEANELVRRLGQGKVTVALDGIRVSPYRYQLHVPVTGGIPENLTLDLKPGDLATVSNTYHGVRPGQIGAISYAAFRPYEFFTLLLVNRIPFPTRQVHYLLANDTRYQQYAWASYSAEPLTGSGLKTYAPGSQEAIDWLKGPLAPSAGGDLVPVQRKNDDLMLNFGEFFDSQNHALTALGQETAARVYRNGELVLETPHALGKASVGVAEPATYRVELDVRKGRPDWTVSTESYSAWTFQSARGPKDTAVNLPVVVNSWNLDLDEHNAAPAGKPFTLRLRPGHQTGAAEIPITAAKVWVSYNDGGTWKRVADLRAADGGHEGEIQHPVKADTTGFVSLRIQITDQQGNQLDQTLMRAYALT